jgi:hypothetical protein
MGTRAEEIATGGGKTVGEIGRLDSREQKKKEKAKQKQKKKQKGKERQEKKKVKETRTYEKNRPSEL